MMWNRMFGQYAWAYWSLISINVVMVQFLWFKKVRQNVGLLFVMSLFVNVGMWLERFVIVVTSLANDFVPSSWAHYTPTSGTSCCIAGTFGLFTTAFLLFLRFLPMISMFEVKTLLPQGKVRLNTDGCTLPRAHTPALHGVMAEYDTGQALVDAARKTMAQGFTRVEAYSPVPIEDLNTIIHKTRTVLPKLVLAGGLAGMATGFALQVPGRR